MSEKGRRHGGSAFTHHEVQETATAVTVWLMVPATLNAGSATGCPHVANAIAPPGAVHDDATTCQTLNGGDVSRPPEPTENQSSLRDTPYSASSFFPILT